jgi:hypothetical protein
VPVNQFYLEVYDNLSTTETMYLQLHTDQEVLTVNDHKCPMPNVLPIGPDNGDFDPKQQSTMQTTCNLTQTY